MELFIAEARSWEFKWMARESHFRSWKRRAEAGRGMSFKGWTTVEDETDDDTSELLHSSLHHDLAEESASGLSFRSQSLRSTAMTTFTSGMPSLVPSSPE